MNRQIKFRFWGKFGELNEEKDECENEMLYGDRFCFSDHAPINDLFADNSFVAMQFTGLKDKNGKEIYEGDIMKITLEGLGFWEKQKDLERIGEVIYNEDYAGFIVKWEYSKNQHHEGLNCDIACTGEIIGNVYENGK